MEKLGRNDPCHCHSGKKYKQCCLDKDVSNTSARLAQEAAQTRALYDSLNPHAPFDFDDDGLDAASNAVVELANAGKLDEAEAKARALLVDFPDVIDGFERLGFVYEKRDDYKTSADYYRKALAFIDEFPDGFEDASRDFYVRKIAVLDPPTV